MDYIGWRLHLAFVTGRDEERTALSSHVQNYNVNLDSSVCDIAKSVDGTVCAQCIENLKHQQHKHHFPPTHTHSLSLHN